jgi:hypothetical protein
MKMRLIASALGVALAAGCKPAPSPPPSPPAPPQAPTPPLAPNAPGSPVNVSGAEQKVRALNSLAATPVDDSDTEDFFARDIAAALEADNRPSEVGAIDFDYRWNAQDLQVTDVSYAVEAKAADKAMVIVTFRNFGKPDRTWYDVCRRPNGQWRVLDVRASESADGGIRHRLHLGKSWDAMTC